MSKVGAAILLAFLLASNSMASSAAETAIAAGVRVDLKVVDRQGVPLQFLRIDLVALTVGDGLPELASRDGAGTRKAVLSATTSLEGFAHFASVPAGVHVVTSHDPQREMAALQENPFAPRSFVVVPAGVESVEDVVVLWSGMGIDFEVSGAGCSDERFTMGLRWEDLDTGRSLPFRWTCPLRKLTLLPGRWRIHPVLPPGWLLTGAALDDVDVGTPFVDVVAEADRGRRMTARFTVEARAELRGTAVLDAAGGCAPVTIRARLVRPGPWIDAARARGGSTYETVESRVGGPPSNCAWRMVVPEGTWSIEPVLPAGGSFEPPVADIVVVRGGSSTRNFIVHMSPRPDASEDDMHLVVSACVEVRGQDGSPVDSAVVEVRDARRPDGPPIGTAKTDARGRAIVIELPTLTPILITAGAADFTDDELELEADSGWQLRVGEECTPETAIELSLRRAGRIVVRALDDADKPVAGMLVATRARARPSRLADARLRELRERSLAVTDSDGRAVLTGRLPGEHGVQTSVSMSEVPVTRIELGRPGEQPASGSSSVFVSDDSEVHLQARVRRAPALDTRLTCAKAQGRLPEWVEFALATPLSASAPAPVEPQPPEQRVLLGARDAVRLGPLPETDTLVAVRPIGFSAWTWVPGTEDRASAITITSEDAMVTTPVPLLEIDCLPRFDLHATAADGLPPDLALAQLVRAAWTAVDPEGSTSRMAGALELRSAASDVVQLSGGADRRSRVDVELWHPHFLPRPVETITTVLDLGWGRTHSLELPLARLGGALLVRTSQPFVVAIQESSRSDAVATFEGEVLVPSLVPGPVVLHGCSDPACADPRSRMEALVTRGETSIVQLP